MNIKAYFGCRDPYWHLEFVPYMVSSLVTLVVCRFVYSWLPGPVRFFLRWYVFLVQSVFMYLQSPWLALIYVLLFAVGAPVAHLLFMFQQFLFVHQCSWFIRRIDWAESILLLRLGDVVADLSRSMNPGQMRLDG